MFVHPRNLQKPTKSILETRRKAHETMNEPSVLSSVDAEGFYDIYSDDENDSEKKTGGCKCFFICLTIVAMIVGAVLIVYKVMTKNTCNLFGVSTARCEDFWFGI